MSAETKSETVAALNDAFRRQPGLGWMLTAGVHALGPAFVGAAVAAVRGHDRFDKDDDPYGEHDFGAVVVERRKLFWKIDCYDLDLVFGSPDPADPAVTRRVLTIMLAEEY
jgi:hypothetical protein